MASKCKLCGSEPTELDSDGERRCTGYDCTMKYTYLTSEQWEKLNGKPVDGVVGESALQGFKAPNRGDRLIFLYLGTQEKGKEFDSEKVLFDLGYSERNAEILDCLETIYVNHRDYGSVDDSLWEWADQLINSNKE